jgi:hypothetical protein
MVPKSPAFSSRDIPSGRRGFDPPPGTVSWKTDHSIPNPGTGPTGFAGRVRIRCRTNCYSPSGGRIPRQRSRAIPPFADCFGPLIAPSLEPVPNRFARVGAGEYGHDGGDPQLGQPVRMRGIVGREIDREASLDCRRQQQALRGAYRRSADRIREGRLLGHTAKDGQAGAPQPWRRTPTRNRQPGRGIRDPSACQARRIQRSSHFRRFEWIP